MTLSPVAISTKSLADDKDFLISPSVSSSEPLTSLELFAGAGGLALGVHLAGFKTLCLVEYDKFAVETLRANSKQLLELPSDLILHADAKTIDYKQFTSKVDLLSGGPPCQPFSSAGLKRGPNDDRNMFPTFVDAMATVRPKAFLIENVKGLLRKNFHDYYMYILQCLRFPLHRMIEGESWIEHYNRLRLITESDFDDEEQYVIESQLIDTADFGIPQRRERVIILGFRRDLELEAFQVKHTHSKMSLFYDQWISRTYWEKYGISPHTDHLSSHDKQLLFSLEKKSFKTDGRLPWRTVRDALYDLPAPVLRGQEPTIPNHVQHPGARVYTSHVGSFWDYPAKALKAGTHGTPGGENMLRFSSEGDVRYFTTREAARLHTFPEEWRFHGTWGACIKQLGNAVPVDLAKLFAMEVHRRLLGVIKPVNNEVNHV